MEKYGVQLDDELVKKGSGERQRCPKCGSPLVNTVPPICPKCGSRPLEKEPDTDEVSDG